MLHIILPSNYYVELLDDFGRGPITLVFSNGTPAENRACFDAGGVAGEVGGRLRIQLDDSHVEEIYQCLLTTKWLSSRRALKSRGQHGLEGIQEKQ